MNAPAARMPLTFAIILVLVLATNIGCRTSSQALLQGSVGPNGRFPIPPAGISVPLAAPTIAPLQQVPTTLPASPLPDPKVKSDNAKSALELSEVLQNVEQQFPLLIAAEQERNIASGQRLAAEGGFDLNLRTRNATQFGTFPSNRFDTVLEQASPLNGLSFFSGYRLGTSDFPSYYGDRITADGGELRGGILAPLLRDRPIDRRRATLRQAQINEALADPIVQRARIDAFRAATRTYWGWVSAGEQCQIAEALLKIAKDRQEGLEQQFEKGSIAEFVVIDNRRLIVERQGVLIGAERRWQQASFELSLFHRDANGNPIVPTNDRLPRSFISLEPNAPSTDQLGSDIRTAFQTRPEFSRFQLLKERAVVELRLSENQLLPFLNASVSGSQDLGQAKKSNLDRSSLEASIMFEVPVQRRDARGKTQAAQSALTQILAQERYARDQIATEVQDAISNLDRTHERLLRAREEQEIAKRVAELEIERFDKGQGTLLEVNLRELAAAGAQIKVVEALADFFRAQADYRAALGLDGKPNANPPAPATESQPPTAEE